MQLACDYHVVESDIVLPETRHATIRDIGYHGVLIDVDDELPMYTEIKLAFDLPLVAYQAQDVYAKVVGQKMKEGRKLMGVEFTSVSPATNMKIQLFVQLLIFTEFT